MCFTFVIFKTLTSTNNFFSKSRMDDLLLIQLPQFSFKISFCIFLAVLSAAGCGFFSSCGRWGLHFVGVRGLLSAVASLVAELQLYGTRASAASGLYSTGSVVMVHGLCCPKSWGIFPDQGSNPCSLH